MIPAFHPYLYPFVINARNENSTRIKIEEATMTPVNDIRHWSSCSSLQ